MKKNDAFLTTCENYTYEGLGVVRVDGFPLFVKGLLAGERAWVAVTKLKKTYGYARIVEVLDASPQRRQPSCPLAARCGGCQLQHMSYEEQLRFKRQKVQDVIDRIAQLPLEVRPVRGMELPYFYRNKAQIPFRMEKGELHSGFYRINSNDIIDMEVCAIQSHAINAVYADVRRLLKERPALWEGLRHVLIKHAFEGKELMVVFISRPSGPSAWKELATELMRLHPQITSVLLNINDRSDNVILGEEEILLAGRAYIEDQMEGLSFHISAKSFYQVNPPQTRVLYQTALEACGLSGTETVLDLYCGVGTISLFLARHAKKVVGIEIVEPAIRNAKENARRNGITNVEFICSDAAAYARTVVQEGIHPDVICVDPPRKGCAKSVLEDIVRMAPERIVYVSCDPGTLARDLRILEDLGYETTWVQPVDMFPQTHSVETVVLLSKGEIDSKKVCVEFSLEDMDMSGFQNDATYGQIKERVLQKTGLKVSSLYIAQIKQKYGIIERENYNKSKSENARQPKCPPEKEAAITEALKFFGMI